MALENESGPIREFEKEDGFNIEIIKDSGLVVGQERGGERVSSINSFNKSGSRRSSGDTGGFNETDSTDSSGCYSF